ncbi:hypothetical protein F5884DRAFT_7373 [Xylogone sp. PMI_703]|nr:hypothetical protein F5884DRAFT_7373 [Xylogone sp. PMI_703]
MAVWSSGLFTSKIFTFKVGENETPMSVHADAFAKQSVVLDRLINGSMKEAQEGTGVWRDVEEETFIRFCQFIYTGDYKAAEHENDSNNPSSPERVKVSPVKRRPDLLREPFEQPRRELPPHRALREEFHSRKYDIQRIPPIANDFFTIRPNKKSDENYTPVFLGHAQLYVLAEKYGVTDLKKLVLYKLHKTLDAFTLYSSRTGDVVELARYVFSDENIPDRPNCEEELRSLVMGYILGNLSDFKTYVKFHKLIEEGGAFERDLLLMILKKVVI